MDDVISVMEPIREHNRFLSDESNVTAYKWSTLVDDFQSVDLTTTEPLDRRQLALLTAMTKSLSVAEVEGKTILAMWAEGEQLI